MSKMAEIEGFEPSESIFAFIPLAGERIRPTLPNFRLKPV